jgi:hypothetical protein
MAYKGKRIRAVLLPLALLGAWIGLHAWADYNWSRKVIEQKTKEGWVVATTYANVIDVTAPWTILKQPITRIIFFKPTEVIAIEKGMLQVGFLMADYDYHTAREDAYGEVIDCERSQSAIVDRNDFLYGRSLNLHTSGQDHTEEINRAVCYSFGLPLGPFGESIEG